MNVKLAKTKAELSRLNVNKVRDAYIDLANNYNHLLNLDTIYCPHCGEWKLAKMFYGSNKTKSGLEHFACRECILDMCTDYDKKTGERTDNKEKLIRTFRQLNWVFIESTYDNQLKIIEAETQQRVRNTAAQQYITMIRSLPQYRGKTFDDSEFITPDQEETKEDDKRIIMKLVKAGKKRFGPDYSDDELMFLEQEYQDWVSRYECNQKAQEEVFENLAMLKLAKRIAIKNNKSTKDIDISYQQWLDTGNLKPKQNNLDTFSDAQTMGTLLQKYEETRPLPEVDPELQDVDKIGLLIEVFYRGHSALMLGLKNRFSNIYQRIMEKYTVKQPEYDEESNSEIIFDKIFGTRDDD